MRELKIIMKQKILNFFTSKKNIFVILIFCLSLISISSSLSLAKYIDENTNEDESTVSLFINRINMEDIEVKKTLDNIAPPEQVELTEDDLHVINFEIHNYQDDDVCEVKINYSFEVKTLNNLPLQLSVVSNSSDLTGYASEDSLSKKEYSTSWTQGVMEAGIKTTHKYKITINWKYGEIDSKYIDEVDELKIVLKTEQVQ